MTQFVDLVTREVDEIISDAAVRLVDSGRLFRRQSASIPRSSYLIVDRPASEQAVSQMQLRLENEERLVLELAAVDGSALDGETDLELVSRLRKTYVELNSVFFAGVPARANLELVFSRNRNSDDLESVSLRFGRFVVENFLDRILSRLKKQGFLTDDEVTKLTETWEVSGRMNLYALQELARRRLEPD